MASTRALCFIVGLTVILLLDLCQSLDSADFTSFKNDYGAPILDKKAGRPWGRPKSKKYTRWMPVQKKFSRWIQRDSVITKRDGEQADVDQRDSNWKF